MVKSEKTEIINLFADGRISLSDGEEIVFIGTIEELAKKKKGKNVMELKKILQDWIKEIDKEVSRKKAYPRIMGNIEV